MLSGDMAVDGLLLRRVGFSRFMDLEDDFEDPELHYLAARMEEPDASRLYRRLHTGQGRLRVWEIVAEPDESLGYATWYAGVRANPSMFIYFFDGVHRPAVAEAIVEAFVHRAFTAAEGEPPDAIDCILAAPPEPNFVAFLTDAGFDATQPNDTDPEIERCFTLLRTTFEAYRDAVDEAR